MVILETLVLILLVGFQSPLCYATERAPMPESPPGNRSLVEGTIRVHPAEVPFSTFASPEARRTFYRLQTAPTAPQFSEGIEAIREFYELYNRERLVEMRGIFAVKITQKTIGGVRVDLVDPAIGVSELNKERVLVNLHGGGFMWGADSGALVEAVPIAATGRIKVLTIDYRLAPEHKFPAAVEDVASVYRELLKTYKPENIGIYGCSAGGVLTAQSVAWFGAHQLPQPGAIATLCATGVDLAGDSSFFGPLAMGLELPPSDRPPLLLADSPYLVGEDPQNPAIFPFYDMKILASFPPTLLIAGSRDFSASSLTVMHRRLRQAGVDAELYLFDGLWHAFMVFPSLPESRETYGIIARFFENHLGRSPE